MCKYHAPVIKRKRKCHVVISMEKIKFEKKTVVLL